MSLNLIYASKFSLESLKKNLNIPKEKANTNENGVVKNIE